MAEEDDLAQGSTIAATPGPPTLDETQVSHTAIPVPPPGPGMAVGRFVLGERLGSGAMGVVYAALDPQLDRRVAIKLIRANTRHGDLHTRLKREAQALARVAHPNVVVVHEVGEHAGQVYLAMELIEGQTMRAWLAAAKRSIPEILDIVVQAGRGLAAAHAAELVHRDFKPDNVLIGADGRARVTDFGLARAQADSPPPPDEAGPSNLSTPATPLDEQLTQTGVMLGTPLYASPEQLAGERVGAASDQFSFCVTAHEALYGVRPFTAESFVEHVAQVTAGTLTPPPNKPVSRRIYDALARGLRPDPEGRWPSMDALLAELVRPQRRRRGIVLGTALALAAGAAGGIAIATREPPAMTCAGEAAAAMDPVWSPARSQELLARLVATRPKHAEMLHASASAQLAYYATDWRRLRVETCTMPVDPERERVIACLDERRVKLDETVRDTLADPAKHLPYLHVEVAPAGTCKLGRADTAEILATREAIANAQRKFLTGARSEARDELGPLLERVEQLVYLPARAELVALLADFWFTAGDSREAERLGRRAMAVAESASDDRTKIESAIIVGESLRQRELHDDAERMFELADATLSRFRANLPLAARLAAARGNLAVDRKQPELAAGHLERALELLDALGADHVGVTTALARVYQQLGRDADARAMMARFEREAAVANLEPAELATTGEAQALFKECQAAMGAGQLARARELCERALAKFGKDSLLAALPLSTLALMAEVVDDRAAARDRYREVVAIYEKRSMNEQLANALDGAARQALELGEPATAVTEYRRAITLLTALDNREDKQLVFSRGGLGRALVAAGEHDAGITELEWVLPRYEVMTEPPRLALANARLALATALWQRNRPDDRSRARVVALAAREDAKDHRKTLAGDTDLERATLKHVDRIAKRIADWLAAHR